MKKIDEMALDGQRDNVLGPSFSYRARRARGNGRDSFYQRFGKRLFDLTFAVLTLPLVLPTLVVLYFFVRRDGGPFFYSQPRVGRDGEMFNCVKVRSMVVNAEDLLEGMFECDEALRREWDEHYKLDGDPRITKTGQLLRKTSIDELPQIFNVLRGEMSVVGPRPITPMELERYGDAAKDYVAVRPGITGLWQITGRREADFENRAILDTKYASKVSFWRDLYIVLATVPEVILARGR
ncbi:MAG: sugar transferase [Pseudomonadota bacterium]